MKLLENYGSNKTKLKSYSYCFNTIKPIPFIVGHGFYINEKVYALPSGEWRYGDPRLPEPSIASSPATTTSSIIPEGIYAHLP